MTPTKYKPKFDKTYFILLLVTAGLILGATVPTAIFAPTTLFITGPVSSFAAYFFISPLFGYVELREDELFIRYGFILKKSIPYRSIREVKKERKFYSESMVTLKNSLEHLNIKYNSFDVTTVSVTDNDALAAELLRRATVN